MTDRGSSSPARRPASLAGRLLLFILCICWGVVSFLFWGFIILTIPFARLFILFPLSLTMIGGAVAAIFFAWHHAWGDAGSAALVSLISVALFGGYSYCAEKMDPSVGRMPPPVRYRYDRWD
jgi:hypothetical protein